MIMQRIENQALGQNDGSTALKKPMDALQIKAAELILSKLVPSLSSTTLDTSNGPLVVELVSFSADSVPKVGK